MSAVRARWSSETLKTAEHEGHKIANALVLRASDSESDGVDLRIGHHASAFWAQTNGHTPFFLREGKLYIMPPKKITKAGRSARPREITTSELLTQVREFGHLVRQQCTELSARLQRRQRELLAKLPSGRIQ